jgi:hypothetical protein
VPVSFSELAGDGVGEDGDGVLLLEGAWARGMEEISRSWERACRVGFDAVLLLLLGGGSEEGD